MSDEYDLTKRAFQEELDRRGVNITFRGVTRRCLPGPIDRKLTNKNAQTEEELGTVADMLNEDFEALGLPALNDDRYPITLSGQQLVIASADTDEQDPCTHFVLKTAR